MNEARQNRFPHVLLCVALSLLLHLLLGLLLLLLPESEKSSTADHEMRKKSRAIRIVRSAARKKADVVKAKPPVPKPEAQPKPVEQKATVKTSADTPQALPDQPDYEGRRSTRAASAPDARHRASAEHAPAMDGRKQEELVTFDQERQDGDLKHEGRNQQQTPRPPQPPPAPEPPVPPAPAPADGTPSGSDSPDAHGQDAEDAQEEAIKTTTPEQGLDGKLKLRQDDASNIRQKKQEAARQGQPGGTGKGNQPTAPARRPRVFYDPSLADWAQPQQPGFRTHERRSRSSGRFILGRGAALNVVSTPRGAYEALVYRQIAHYWYIACDEHRGDIIPGSITISLRITRRGQIDSMALIRRSGASISQQSFTFKAIRRANLPPMPQEVQADVIGNLMELIFVFNFD